MENATKALLMAGAVLIAILLIAMGMRVFNSTTGTAEQTKSTMQTAEITQFNNQFTQYFGDNKTKSEIVALANKIIANNATSDEHIVQFVYYTPRGNSMPYTDATNIMSGVKQLSDSSNHTVSFEYDDDGYINKVIVR